MAAVKRNSNVICRYYPLAQCGKEIISALALVRSPPVAGPEAGAPTGRPPRLDWVMLRCSALLYSVDFARPKIPRRKTRGHELRISHRRSLGGPAVSAGNRPQAGMANRRVEGDKIAEIPLARKEIFPAQGPYCYNLPSLIRPVSLSVGREANLGPRSRSTKTKLPRPPVFATCQEYPVLCQYQVSPLISRP
jgi:hypothetical protein